MVPILAFTETPGCNLAKVAFKSVEQLSVTATSPSSTKINIIWTAHCFIEDGRKPNWSEFMQSEHLSFCVTKFPFLSIVSLPPANENWVLSIIVVCIEKEAKFMNMPNPCITIDQLLFVEALNVASANDLNIVIRLCGFNVILSFLCT